MQGNQKNWRLIANGLAIKSGLCLSWLILSMGTITAVKTPTLAQAPTETPTETPAETAPTQAAETPPNTTPNTTAIAAQADAENTLNNLISLMLGLLVLILGAGVIMLWFLRRSVVNEVATIVRTQLNEMTELENKVHNATRSLNRVLADADELSGELQG
ncbi:MAG: hypothetical protein AAFZ17_15720, partial [Cyanobacteria bacterium J06650_10]